MNRNKLTKSNKDESIQSSSRKLVRQKSVKFLETTVQDNISPKIKFHQLKSSGEIYNNDLSFNVQTENSLENDSQKNKNNEAEEHSNSNEINSDNIKRGPRKFTSSFKRKSSFKNKDNNNSINDKGENSKTLIEKISPLKIEKIESVAGRRRFHRRNTKNKENDDDDDNNEVKNEDKIDENNKIDIRRDKRFKKLKTKDYRTKKDYKAKHHEEKKEEKIDETDSSNSNELQVSSRYIKNKFTKGRLVGDSSDKLTKVEIPPKQNEEKKEIRNSIYER